MKPSVKITLAGLVVVLVAVFFFMKKPASNQPSVVTNSQSEGTKESSLVYPKKNGQSTKTTTPVAKKELPENPYLTKESLSSLPTEMKEFLILDMKSIKNEEETRNYYSLLRSPEALQEAQKILLSVYSEREHLTATRFLAKALGDLNNKSNKALNDVVKKIILEDNISGSYPEEAKMIFAGDKAELAQTYIAFNPNSHKELMEKTKNSNIKKIIENAYAYNLTMRAGN